VILPSLLLRVFRLQAQHRSLSTCCIWNARDTKDTRAHWTPWK